MDNQFDRYDRKIRAILQIAPKTIHKELVTALGSSASSYTAVTRWSKHFREERKNVNDHPRFVSPLFQFTGENIELVRQVISNDLHSIYDEIIAEITLSLMIQ